MTGWVTEGLVASAFFLKGRQHYPDATRTAPDFSSKAAMRRQPPSQLAFDDTRKGAAGSTTWMGIRLRHELTVISIHPWRLPAKEPPAAGCGPRKADGTACAGQ